MSELSVRETAARALWDRRTDGGRYDIAPEMALADAVLAAVADHDGLADVLRGHIFDPHTGGCKCGRPLARYEDGWGYDLPAHLADVVRAWLRGDT